MTTGGDQLFVTVGGRDIGLEALLKKVDAEMQHSADSAVRLGQQYARLAQAQGSPAAASNILAGTMQRAGAASERSLIGLATQQANLGNSSRNLTGTIAGLGGQLSQLGGSAGSLAGSIGNLAGSFGTLGGIGAAIGISKVVVDMGVAGAQADLLRERFDGLAVAAGTTGEALIGALRAASGGEISDLNLTLAANKAQLLGVADSAEEFSVLMGIARDRAQQMGISTTQAFNDLTTGLGRGSALILDNLGIIVSVKEANDAYAKSLGTTADKLTDAQQKQALINQVLAQGRASLEQTGGAVQSTAGTFAQFQANLANITSGLGSFFAGGLQPLAQGFNDTAAATGALITSLQQLGTTTADAALSQQAEAAGLAAFDAAMQASGDATQAEAAYQAARSGVLRDAAAAQAEAAASAQYLTGAYAANSAAAIANADASTHAATQIAAHAAAVEESAAKAQIATLASQELAATQGRLAQAAQTAANVILAGGGNIAATANALANSSSQVDVLTAAYLRLAQAQAAATGAKLAAQTPRQLIGADSDQAAVRAEQRAAVQENRSARIKAAQDAAEAERKYQTVLGHTGPALAHARAELAQLTVGSAAYINKQIEIAQLDKKGTKAGGGGGGSVKLTDQTKLQNSLLASQEDYQQKSEDAATQHAIDVEKINLDFYARMQTAERDFNQSQLEGRAGFYDQLGGIENQKIAQAASQQYEAASIEAGKIAQEKGADVAEKYMNAQEQIISARAKRLSDIEKAEKDKDKGKAEYLKGVDAEYKKAEDAKLARIQEGEGSLAAERDKQLAESAAKEADAQDKIGLSADRAAEKKIAASTRAGAAIDAEQLKVGGLTTAYDALGAAGSRAGITPSPATPSTPTTTPAAATATPAPAADPIAVALDGLREAIAAVERATKSAGDQVAGAVRQSATGRLAA